MHLTLEWLPLPLTVCRLGANEEVPVWAAESRGFLSITRTAGELSLVCATDLFPPAVKQEPGWRAFKVAGPLDFGLTGVLVSILAPLAKAQLSVFSVSTFDTDHVLVRETSLAQAGRVLEAAGHTVKPA